MRGMRWHTKRDDVVLLAICLKVGESGRPRALNAEEPECNPVTARVPCQSFKV